MADVAVTAANVRSGERAQVDREAVLGAAVTAGQVTYKDPADGKLKLADANGASAAIRTGYGMALNGGADGQPAAAQRSGRYKPGGTVVVGTIYVLSATPGAICPAADLATGHHVCIIGVGVAADEIELIMANSGALVPAS